MTANDTTIIPSSVDEETLAHIYTEAQGPRKGIHLTFDQAQRLLHFHLPGKQLKELSYFNRGYNNRVYLACCTDASEYVIRLGGRLWDHRKITNEVQALALARKALVNVVQVPTIIGTSVDQTHTKIIPHDYIVMSRLPGVPLDSIWDDMSLEEQEKVVDQVAEIFARLRSIELPEIGNFVKGPNGEPTIGPMMEGSSGSGPYQSWGAFAVANIQKEINWLQSDGKFAETMAYLPRIETLVKTIELGDLEKRFQGASTQDASPISFTHGDFESRNILVIGHKVVGLLDFEFAGGFPSEQEWCAGFEWLFARAEDPFDKGEEEKLKNMSQDQKQLLDYFLRILEDKYGIQQFGKVCEEYKVVLYHLQINMAPWWLRDIPKEDWTDKQRQSMMTAADSLDKALTFLGC
ncbi:MAG: kinase-like domain-containing protein [Benniella sp.]|nr:MAG: kinase-like domain-containing protein [Benniella sp.]